MDANKPVSPRDVQIESTTGPVQKPVTKAIGDGQHASAPQVYVVGDALPRLMTGSAPVAHDGMSASVPQWEDSAASSISLQEGSDTTPSSSSGQTTNRVAQAYKSLVNSVMAGDTRFLQIFFDVLKDENIQDRYCGFLINHCWNADGDCLLDIAASRMDLKIGLMLVEKGAKPGPNCPKQFLDSLLEQAIASRSKNAMRNLLGYGADWNLFFYSEQRHQFDFITSKDFLLPACRFHCIAGNRQPVLDIFCLLTGTGKKNNEMFDEEIENYLSEEGQDQLEFLLEIRADVVEAKLSTPTAAMLRAIQAAASANDATTLEILLDYQISVRNGDSASSNSSNAPGKGTDNISLPSQILDIKNQQGCTLLHLAAYSGSAKNVALLLSHGTNLRALDGKKQSALAIAVKCNRVNSAVCLLQAALAAMDDWPGAKAMIRDALKGASPGMIAALRNVYAELRPGPPVKVAAPLPYAPHEDL